MDQLPLNRDRRETMTRRFRLKNHDGKDVTEDLSHFAETIGLEQAASGRHSVVLLLGLFGGILCASTEHLRRARRSELLPQPRAPRQWGCRASAPD